MPGWFAIPRAIPCLLIGLLTLFSGLTLNALCDRVLLFRPFRWPKRARLSDFNRVMLYRFSSPATYYAIALASGSGSQQLPLLSFSRYIQARRVAERIARITAFDIYDLVFEPMIVRPRVKVAYDSATGQGRVASDGDAVESLPEFAAFSPIRGFEGDPDVLAIQHKVARRYAILKVFLALFGLPLLWLLVVLGGAEWTATVASIVIVLVTVDFIRARRGIVFLRDQDVCYTWRYFRSPRRLQAHRLAPFTEVTVTAEKYAVAQQRSRTYFCVRLDGNAAPLEIQETSNESAARDIAARVSELIGVPLRDFTRVTAESRRSLHRRIFQSADRWNLPHLPPDSRIAMTRTDEDCVFRIPAIGLGWSIPALLLVLATPFLSLFALVVLDPKMLMKGVGPPWLPEALSLSCMFLLMASLLAIVGYVFPFVRTRLRRERIFVRPDGIRSESRSLIGKKVMQADRNAIVDITIGPPTSDYFTQSAFGHFPPKEVIRVAENVRVVEFGGVASHAERVWLQAAVAAILLSRHDHESLNDAG